MGLEMEIEITDLVSVYGRKIKTDSLIVAEMFGKKPKSVNRKIENLIKDDDSSRLSFAPRDYKDTRGKSQIYYEMDRRSFSILCMGFTGKDALKWKHRFYDAFEAMERVLLQQMNESWRSSRIEGKAERQGLTDAIQQLVIFAEENGSRNASKYYTTFTKLIYKYLFGIDKAPDGFRDTLDQTSLKRLQLIEGQVALWILQSLASADDYHQPYQDVKGKIGTLVQLTGGEAVFKIAA